MALNVKQQTFVAEYLIDLNATQAAIRAGYSEATAYSQGQRLLKHVEVAALIQKAMDERSERTEITADYVLTTIQETIEQCRKLEPVINDGQITMPWNPAAVLKGAELLGKHLKLFTDKVEHSGGLSVVAVNELDQDI